MQRFMARIIVGLVLFAGAPPAQAGVFADDLSRCVVSKASPADFDVIIRWVFSAMATNPSIKSLTTLTDADRERMDEQFAALTDRLLLSDCRTQLSTAMKAEGNSVIEKSFQMLGGAAMNALMGSPQAQAAVGAFAAKLSEEKWEAFRKEAGLPEPRLAKPKP